MNDVSGQPLGSTVYGWVEDADSLVADISEPNYNVTYEVGLAIGMSKPLRLIRSESKDWTKVQEIGLLHNIGHDSYGKVSVASVEWNDVQLIENMFENRVMRGFAGKSVTWQDVWNSITVPTVKGKPVLSFLIESSLMRPRYLIRLFETARRRAVTLRKKVIEEEDYLKAQEELGWQVMEDVSHELTDVVPEAEDLLFDLTALGPKTSLNEVREVILKRVKPERVDPVLDVLIWSGCIGVDGPKGPTYISDCGFRRPFIRALMNDGNKKMVLLHPTLSSLIA
jgi:hypothetical protein